MTRGIQLAGYEVTGVDHVEQPNYCGDHFILGNALEVSLEGYDAVFASPPCQAYSATASLHSNEYPELIDWIRCRLLSLDVPWCIENVVGAPLRNPLMLCGSSFGLGVRRHRLFETSPMIALRPSCVHHLQPEPLDVTGGGPTKPGRTRTTGGVSRKPRTLAEAKAAMGVDWEITRAELNEAVPPAYGQFVATQLLSSIRTAA